MIPGGPALALVERLEARLAERLASPTRARLAAGLFVTSVALGLAGVVGAVGVASPTPAVHLLRLTAAQAEAVQAQAQAQAAAIAPAAGQPAATSQVPTSSTPESPEESAPPALAVPEAQPAVAEEAVAPPTPPSTRGALPIGKGMWIWLHDQADGGDPESIVRRARDNGLTHLYVRTGTRNEGFMGGPFLDRLLPVAHANNIRVYGWDFPFLHHPGAEVERAVAAIRYTTPDGHRIDGFSADIESPSEGTNNNPEYVNAYGSWLRQHVGPDYPLIATVPNPTGARLKQGFPYAEIMAHFDAVAPMVYWMNRDPGSDAAHAVSWLSQFGKPVFPVGQAYDGGPEGGPHGAPGRDQLIRFMQSAEQAGAAGVSFWSWQHATQEAWDAVRDAAEFRLDQGGPNGEGLTAGMVRAYQLTLSRLGFATPVDGVWSQATIDAIVGYQKAARLRPNGHIDETTRSFLLTPILAPLSQG